MTLPIFLTPKTKWPVGALAGGIATAMYLLSNHIHLFEPRQLPMTWIDEAIPFLPHTLWIYTSEYYLFISVYILAKDMASVNKYLYSFMALQTVSVLIFIFWPTTFPRDAFPLPETLDDLTYHAFAFLRTADSPASCAPSLHVSSCYLSSFIFLTEQKKKFPFFFCWATAVAITTLTTKQHYLIDVIWGFGMAILFYWIFHRWIPYRYIAGDQANR